MKILADGNWSVPHEFENHDEQGRALRPERLQKQAAWQKEKFSAGASGIEDLIEQRQKRSEKESLTEKALSLAKGLMNLAKKRQEKGANEIFEQYTHQLKELFAQGADRESVALALRG